MAERRQLFTPDGTAASSFSFGAMQFGGRASEEDSQAMYADCRAAGINFFDTAYVYTEGRSETLLGQFAAAERDQVIIASKVSWIDGNGSNSIENSFDESRSRLGMDMIDLLYLHRFDPDTPLEESFDALASLQADGKIRYIGISNFAAWQVVKAVGIAAQFGVTVDVLQPMYNLVKRQVEVEILPACADQDVLVAPYSPLGGGLLTGKYASGGEGRLLTNKMYTARYNVDWMHEAAAALPAIAQRHGTTAATLAVAWVARNPLVAHPIISARTAEQLQPSLAAIDFDMTDELYDEMTALTVTPPPATDRLEER